MGTLIGIWIAAFLTLAILSFLYRDNPFYKLAEHVYVGISAGYWIIYVWCFDVWPQLVVPFRERTGVEKWILVVPASLGLMMLSRWFPKLAWVSRWPIAFTVGIGAGLGMTGDVQGYIIPQVQATLLPLGNLNYVLLVVGTAATIVYFYFSRPHRGALGALSRLGIVFIMVAFGASFGYTVMARISLLIGRFHFLLADWLHIVR
jgi:hypothetical protein